MYDHEEEREDDAGKKDEDAAKLVNHKVGKAEGGHHHHCWVVLLQGFHLNLEIFRGWKVNYLLLKLKQNTNEMGTHGKPIDTKNGEKDLGFVGPIPNLVLIAVSIFGTWVCAK